MKLLIEQMVREVEARNRCTPEEADEAVAFFNGLTERLQRGELTEESSQKEVVAFALSQVERRQR